MKSEGVEPTNVERYYIYTHQRGSSFEERKDSVLFPFYRILFSETLLYHVKLECQELSFKGLLLSTQGLVLCIRPEAKDRWKRREKQL